MILTGESRVGSNGGIVTGESRSVRRKPAPLPF
jgi:hypothetical protein